MSSIRLFKKEINNIVGSYIEEVYDWELNHPDADLESTEQLIDKSIALFDDLIGFSLTYSIADFVIIIHVNVLFSLSI